MAYKPAKRTNAKKGTKYPKSKKAVVKQTLRKNYVGSVKKIVKSVMHRNQEVKYSPCFTATVVPIVPTSSSVPSTLYAITDEVFSLITQGVGQGQRVGNQIELTNFSVRGVITCDVLQPATTLTNAPAYVKFWFFRPKNIKEYSSFSGTLNNFFQNGSNSVGFSNTLIDMVRPVNKDYYNVYETRKFKLGRSDADASGVRMGNNDFKLSQTFNVNLTKHLPKKIRFDDAGVNPVNCLIIWMAEIYNADGSAVSQIDPANYPSVSMCFDTYCTYRDD